MLIDVDPLSGAVETVTYDLATRSLVTTREENVDALLTANTERYNDVDRYRRGIKNSFLHVGSISLTTLYAWMQEFNASKRREDWLHSPFVYGSRAGDPDWDKFVDRKLNCSDFRKLRTAPGRI